MMRLRRAFRHEHDIKMLVKSMSMKVCSPKRKDRAGAPAILSGSDVVAATGGAKAGGTANDVTLFYITSSPAVYPRMWPRNAPSRSKIEARKDRPGPRTPTAPGGHAIGDNGATKLPVTPGSTGGRAEANRHNKYGAPLKPVTNGTGSRPFPAGPEGGKRGVRAMGGDRLVQLPTPPTPPVDKPTACTQPPWQAILDRIDAEQTAKVLRVLGKRPSK